MPAELPYRVVPADGGRWVIMDPHDQLVFGDRDYASRELAMEAIARLVGRMNVQITPSGSPGPSTSGLHARDPRKAVALRLRVSAGLDELLKSMSHETGIDPSEIVRRALGLYRIALDAKAEGNRVAILTPEMDADQEITGI